MPLFSTSPPRKRLLAHLSQAVETLALRTPPNTLEVPLEGAAHGNVKVRFFEVNRLEFDHFENVSKALTRIDQGTYGRCTGCDGHIEAHVLAEIPLATQCLECEDQEAQP